MEQLLTEEEKYFILHSTKRFVEDLELTFDENHPDGFAYTYNRDITGEKVAIKTSHTKEEWIKMAKILQESVINKIKV